MIVLPRIVTSYLRIVTSYLVTLLVITWSLSAAAQETRCLTATELNEITDYLCSRARQKELQYDELRLRLDSTLTRAIAAESKLEEYRTVDSRRVELERELAVVRASTMPKSHVILVVVGGFVVGAGVGALIGLAL